MTDSRLQAALRWWRHERTTANPCLTFDEERHIDELADAARNAESAREQGFREAVEKCAWYVKNRDINPQISEEYGFETTAAIRFTQDAISEELRSLSPDEGVCEWRCSKDRLPLIGQWVWLCLKGVVQREAFYLDQGDNGLEYWDRDDLDEGLTVNDDDYWMPLPTKPIHVKEAE